MKKTWILLLIFFSAGILSYADAQSVKFEYERIQSTDLGFRKE